MKYNQAATGLANVQGWWMALSAEEQADQKNVDKLVEYTEKAIAGELTGWVQQMQDVLAACTPSRPGRRRERRAYVGSEMRELLGAQPHLSLFTF